MRRRYRTVALVIFTAGLSTCGGSGGSGSGMGLPSGSGATFGVEGSIPAAGASDVSLGTQIQVRFEFPVNPSTVTSQSFSVSAGQIVSGALQVAGDTVLFTPSEALVPVAQHTIRLAATIGSMAGETLGTEQLILFQTRDGAWGGTQILPTEATVAGLATTRTGQRVALRLDRSSPFSDLAVTRAESGSSEWTSGVQLFNDGSIAFADLALDEDGWGIAAVNRNLGGNTFAIWASVRSPMGVWAMPEEAAPVDSGFTEPQIEIVAPGDALLAYRRNAGGEVWARAFDVAEGWAAAVRLSTEGAVADAPYIASDGDGAAVVVWREDSQRVLAARYSAALGWITPPGTGEVVQDAFACCISEPRAAAAPGVAPAVILHSGGFVSVSRFQPETGLWSLAQPINGPGCSGTLGDLSLALDPAGRAFASWTCSGVLWATSMDMDAPWLEPFALDDSGSASDSLLVVDANGNATLLWTRAPGQTRELIARRKPLLADWGPEVPLSMGPVCAGAPQLARTPSALHAAWTITIACDFNQGTGARAATFD